MNYAYTVEEAFEGFLAQRVASLHREVRNGSHNEGSAANCNACRAYLVRMRLGERGTFEAGFKYGRVEVH